MQAITSLHSDQNRPEAPRLWELGNSVAELEHLVFDILDADNLSDEGREIRANAVLEKWLNAGSDFDEKAVKVAEYIKHQEALAEARRNEYRRLRTLAEQAQNEADALRRYLTYEMIRSGRTKIEGLHAKLSVRRKQPQVLLNCEPEQLPPDYVKVTYEPRLGDIRKAIKRDPSLTWAFLSEHVECSLIIR